MKITFLLFFFALPTWAQGNDVENGGDTVAYEFTVTARLALAQLNKVPLTPELSAWVKTLSKSLALVQVNSVPTLYLRGNEVDAINYPLQKRILVSRDRWQEAKYGSAENRIGFVLHEYLGVSQIDDSRYLHSQTLVEAMGPDFLGNLMAQEIFSKELQDIGSKFWNCNLNFEYDQKEVCIFSGEISARVQLLTQTVTDNPNWFRSKKIQTYSDELKNVAAEIKNECLNKIVSYKNLKNACGRGEYLTGTLSFLLFSY